MKKIVLFCLVLFILFFRLFNLVKAEESEIIKEYNVTIDINTDSTINVTEEITYDFGTNERHGIYRDIPYKYETKYINFKTALDVLSVKQDNRSVPYQVSWINNDIRIKIGDPNILISGVKIYEINYQVDRVINFFDEHDELYWNVTGNEWPVEIQSTNVLLNLPTNINKSDIQATCFTGDYGSTNQDCLSIISNDQITFETSKNLKSSEGLTIVIGIPKNILQKPSFLSNIIYYLKNYLIVFLPFLVFIIMYYIWRKHGRDLGSKRSIIPRYVAPEGLRPAEMGSLYDEKINLKDLSSTLIDFAINGYIKIKEFGKDWILIKLKEPTNLKEWERKYFEAIFNNEKEIKVSDLKNKFYTNLITIKRLLFIELLNNNYFSKSSEKIKKSINVVFIILLFMTILFFSFIKVNAIFLIISIFIILIFNKYMSQKTKEGTLKAQEILGYKMFLEVTEKDRLKFHNAPEKKPESFEQHLPYAMALGVEKEWAKQFKDLYISRPNWYEGNFTTFNSLYFVGSIGSLNKSFKTSIASKPGGVAGGSSGFGGGGFGGGGFGGGGGGSW